MPRPLVALLLLACLATSLPAEDLAARLRARMKDRPKPAASRLKASPGNQSACQGQIARTRFPAVPHSTAPLHGYALNPVARLLQCPGSATVQRNLERKLPGTLAGTEAPVWGLGGSPDHALLFIQLGTRVQGERNVADPLKIGMDLIKNGKGIKLGVFGRGGDMIGNSKMVFSFSPWDPDVSKSDVPQTMAPWVIARLDDGDLYYGQFGRGAPDGFGWKFSDDMRRGRMGFYDFGRPEGVGVEWETHQEKRYRKGGSKAQALPASVDRVRVVFHRDGELAHEKLLQDGSSEWLPVDREAGRFDGNFVDRKAKEERLRQQEREAREARAQAARDAVWAKLKAGDLVEKGGKYALLLADPGKGPGITEATKAAAYGTVETLDTSMKLARVEPGDKAFFVGIGFLEPGSPELRSLLTRELGKRKAKVEEAKRAAEGAKRAAEELERRQREAQATAASYNQNYQSPSSPVSTYRPSAPTANSGPRIGSQAWWDQRAAFEPSLTPLARSP